MHIPPGERQRQPDSPRRPLGGSAPRPGLPGAASPAALSVGDTRLPPPLRSAPRRAAPHGGAAGSSGTGSADSPPANTRPPARAWNIQKHKGKVAAGLFWGQNAGSLGTTV
ncbi:multifunctional 2-oxoglutarate metabolism enzyme-like isoform X2 [Vidua chalybeata]|uniref:multifunctional 2-oxoglutarate metabolism enzyme-like isoform X2 n=1 Tax=Vidua chalybeata TaxID=81927 RepID=UPI0023A84E60|nr:multifunctional 2-oxoglutarate metabolism enzyme-like isoform X2 [Vidua chalybeata]